MQVLFEFFELFLAGEHFFAGEFGDFGILGHFFGRSDVLERLFVFLGLENNRFDFGAFARKFREALHVVCCIRCCEHGIEFFKTTAKTEKLGANVFFHGTKRTAGYFRRPGKIRMRKSLKKADATEIVRVRCLSLKKEEF